MKLILTNKPPRTRLQRRATARRIWRPRRPYPIPTLLSVLALTLATFAQPQIGQPAPDFSATDISGQTVKLSDYKGKIVVLESFGWQTPRTRQEYASGAAQRVQHLLATNSVVYLIIDPGLDHLTPAEAKLAWSNRKMEITDWIIDGPGAPLTQLYGLAAIGQMFVIDKNGTLAYSGERDDTPNPGASPLRSRNYVFQSVRELLAGKKVSAPRVPVREFVSDDSPPPQIGKPAPDFIATDINGQMFRFSDYKGKNVVVEAYESGCPFVETEYQTGAMPQLQKQLASNGVAWITINMRTLNQFQAPFSPAEAKKDGNYAKMLFARYVIDDPSHSLARLYRISATPQMFVINKEGLLAYIGAIDDDHTLYGDRRAARNYVRQAASELLAGKMVSVPLTKPFGCALIYPGMWNAQMFQPPAFLLNQ